MTDDQRKKLTEYLGKDEPRCLRCGNIKGFDLHLPQNIFHPDSHYFISGEFPRTFTTAQDRDDLVNKMVINHDWHSFYSWVTSHSPDTQVDVVYENKESAFVRWLITNPARFCNLVAEWRESLP